MGAFGGGVVSAVGVVGVVGVVSSGDGVLARASSARRFSQREASCRAVGRG